MSITAVGPATTLDGPLPVEPPYSLLNVPGVLVDSGDERYLNGVNLWGYPADTPSTWEPCSDGTFRVKSEESDQPQARFDPFAAYIPIACSALGMPSGFAQRAEVVLDATLSFAVEDALANGIIGSTNPFFGDGNVTILGGGAVTPEVGLRWLERAIGQTARRGLIHAPPEIVAAWEFEALETGAELRTPNGTPVAAGGGYIDAFPVSAGAPASGTAYAWATGPVEVRLAPFQLIPEDISEALDRSVNDVVYRAERYVLATWDGALQAAVLIDWTP